MAVKFLDKEGVYSCTIISAQKTKAKTILLTLKTNAGVTKLRLDTVNQIADRGQFSAILDVIDFTGIIQRPEEVIGGRFQAELRPNGEFTNIVWLNKETAKC